MNAYELADHIETFYYELKGFEEPVATMLRQQADRIAELEKNLLYGFQTFYKSKEDIDFRVHRLMCDKLAWEMTDDGHMTPTQVGIEARRRINGEAPYTHPHSAESVKVKQLSDEEIVLMYYHPDFRYEDGMLNYMKFARAIIKEIIE